MAEIPSIANSIASGLAAPAVAASVGLDSLAIWQALCAELHNVNIQSARWVLPNNFISRVTGSTVDMLSSYRTLNAHAACPVDGTSQHYLIQGQSSTGKSTYILVLMRALMYLRRPFVYSSFDDANKYYAWDPIANPQSFMITEDNGFFNRPEVTWFINQREHGRHAVVSCRKVLVASPARINYKTYYSTHLQSLRVIHMPLPTRAECQAVATLNGRTVPEFNERYRKFGPIFAFCCGAHMSTLEEALEMALVACDYQATIFNSEAYVMDTDVTHRIFHVSANANFEATPRVFGTEYISECYCLRWRAARRDTYIAYLSMAHPEAPIEYGRAFELFCHTTIADGTQMEYEGKRLHPLLSSGPLQAGQRINRSQRGAINIPAYPVLMLNSNAITFAAMHTASINAGEGGLVGRYLKPRLDNFGAVEAVVLHPPDSPTVDAFLFQATSNIGHGVNSTALRLLIEAIDAFSALVRGNANRGNFILFFVIPQRLVEDYPRQAYALGQNAPAGSGLLPAQLDRIEMRSIGIKTAPVIRANVNP